MNQFLQQGVTTSGQVVRSLAIVGADLASQFGQFALSAVTGVVVIGAGHLLGNSAYRGLGDAGAAPEMPAATTATSTFTPATFAPSQPMHAA